MKFISVCIMVTTLAAGLVGSAFAYQLASADNAGKSPASVSAAQPPAGAQVVRPGTRFKWAPCRPNSRLEKGVCVTDVVRTVVIPGPVVQVAAAPAAAPAAQAGISSPPAQGGDDGGQEAGNGGGTYHGDDGGNAEEGDGGDDGGGGGGNNNGGDDD